MVQGDYFGETALVTNDVRTASVIASSDKVECAGIDRETFEELLGTYDQFKTLKKKTFKRLKLLSKYYLSFLP